MLSWLRRFPHDVIHRKEEKHNVNGGRRTSSSTTWRNKTTGSSSSFTARIIRCASSVVDRRRDQQQLPEDDDDEAAASSVAPSRQKQQKDGDDDRHYDFYDDGSTVVSARAFSFRELADAAGNFRQANLIGEGGFGRVYKARVRRIGAGAGDDHQTVAVKQLDRNGAQGNSEFVVEVMMLSMLRHPNLVNLVGYCADGHQRLLVYEYMARGSLEDHLLLHHHPHHHHHHRRGLGSTGAGDDDDDNDDQPSRRPPPPLPWRTRMRVAHGAARGLEYLHGRDVIYRDLKSSNILLDDGYSPRLSDFGLARLLPAPRNDSDCSSSSASSASSNRVMGTYGYCAPEYLRTGKLSAMSDVYSFGVLMLELITARRAIDASRPDGEQSLVGWASTIMRGDPGRFHELVDPRLVMAMQAPAPSELKQAVGVAAMCLQEHAALRPVMADVVTSLSFLTADRQSSSPSS